VGFAYRRTRLATIPSVPPLPPLPQDPQIQVFFNQSETSQYQEPYRSQSRPGDNLEQVLIDAIARADQSIAVAIQELRLPLLAEALAAKARSGIEVRVILENSYRRGWSQYSATEVKALSERERSRYDEFLLLADRNQDGTVTQAEKQQNDAIAILEAAQIPILDDTADASKGSGLMHHKFVVIDASTVLTGSVNFTTSGVHGDFVQPDSRGNANFLLQIESAAIAQLFLEEFALMWGDGPGGQPDSQFGVQKAERPIAAVQVGDSLVQVHFSPASRSVPWEETGNGLIDQTLATATRSIDLALFVFSEQRLADVLRQRAQQGVAIRALIDPGFAFRNYSEGLDLLGVALPKDCAYEADNAPWSPGLTTVGIPQLPEGDLLHHKFGVVDATTTIAGSHNWSPTANHNNDETVLVIENPVVARHFEREFNRLYKTAVLGVPPWLQRRIEQAEANCQLF
jgi:phosphatidylserine/phosphatidylglycerophosphate/cardiolipin synthase-like enzyme